MSPKGDTTTTDRWRVVQRGNPMKYSSLAAVGAATMLSLAGAGLTASSALGLTGVDSARATSAGAASASAAAVVPECGGFTQAQAVALGYNTTVRGGGNNVINGVA